MIDRKLYLGDDGSIRADSELFAEAMLHTDAEEIIKRWNSHYELVRLLKEALLRICQDLPKPMNAGMHEYLSVLENEIQNAIKEAEAI